MSLLTQNIPTMKKLITTIIVALLPILAIAQTQEGYVKTLGRQNNAGKPLSGVTIRQSGAHNAVVSGSNGSFSLNMISKKLGEAYSLQQVSKNKYELVDNGVVGRQYAYSNTVPLTIVMVSTEELEKDKMRIENNAYKRAEKDYQIKSATLEKQLKEHAISEEKYREEIQALINNFDKYQSMIEGLADHYARTDYDFLDDREREINLCIENGELKRAESLLHSIDNFDPIEVLKRNKEALLNLEAQISQAEAMIDQANADMAEVLRRQEKDAEYLYQLYTIALARYDNEKAAQYLETRAALDSTNVAWQLDAGMFISEYLANYNKALEYYNCALKNALVQYGERHELVAVSYNNIGIVYSAQGNYDKALNYCQKALDIFIEIFGENNANVAAFYNNIGGIYSAQGNYDEALNCSQKALKISLQVFGENHQNVAISYNRIGGVYYAQGYIDEALNCFQKDLKISSQIFGEDHPNVATSYSRIGGVYYEHGNFEEALNYHQKALDIRLQVFGENHPEVAISYNNIGIVYSAQGNYDETLNYYIRTLKINLEIFGENHPDVAVSYNNIGIVYSAQGNYDEALNYFQKALKINLEIFGENNPNLVYSYNHIMEVYLAQGDYYEALNYYQKALTIISEVWGENHPKVIQARRTIDLIKSQIESSK